MEVVLPGLTLAVFMVNFVHQYCMKNGIELRAELGLLACVCVFDHWAAGMLEELVPIGKEGLHFAGHVLALDGCPAFLW